MKKGLVSIKDIIEEKLSNREKKTVDGKENVSKVEDEVHKIKENFLKIEDEVNNIEENIKKKTEVKFGKKIEKSFDNDEF